MDIPQNIIEMHTNLLFAVDAVEAVDVVATGLKNTIATMFAMMHTEGWTMYVCVCLCWCVFYIHRSRGLDLSRKD